ncbi:hypothetical protein N658DRAFT_563345 [Parathielavia hyrcaniae]|uniref:J domain-containing protein n=1 Tax=Parathielavia hyrcaniae TaxID=113614 RepID=A0AAN6QBI3_9PEZI|nr:hypothetical protein N658DRAFT_563345 [Parathielavia hyrcaniae]
MEPPRSPKRRRILSSINPPIPNDEDDASKRSHHDRIMSPDDFASPTDDVPTAQDDAPRQEASDRPGSDTTVPRPTKFRFKSESSRSLRRRERGEDDDDDDNRRRRHRHYRSRSPASRDRDRNESRERRHHHRRYHHHHRRHRRTHRSRSPPRPKEKEQEQERNPFQDPPLSPTTAFRESLFDAMADDEGAAYWESVYGQPIHVYPPPNITNTNNTTTSSSGGGGNSHHLDRMTDDEYAAYVRQKMWEKTHAGLLEARARREWEREEAGRRAEEEARVAREMERCLRRGQERRRRKGWRERWEGYVTRWAAWEEEGRKGGGGVKVEGIPWPKGAGGGSSAGDGTGVERETVRAFFVNGLGLDEVGEKEFAARLKEERVRWHPDKMQQRLGGQVEDKVMRDVTAIFQVVDALWNDTRKKGG